jgi:outer membrane protein OmpA-like peptidoglycan-associated protein
MRNMPNTAAILCIALALVAMPAGAQSRTDREKLAAQQELTAAESALASAEAAGAATLAPALLGEARTRLQIARRDWNSSKKETRYDATLRAIEAGHAARTAEAQAALVAANNEIRTLRTSMTSAGGTAAAPALYEPPANLSRGATSMDRVIIAENALRGARSAGGESVAPVLLQHTEETLKTARNLASRDTQSPTADHLAFVAEMQSRRTEFMARRNAVTSELSGLRNQRARLGESAPATPVVIFDDSNRQARIAAERDLEALQRRYDAALREGQMSRGEVDSLRRQVDEQSAALRTLQERERAGEASRGNEIQALESSLERERNEGRLTAEVLAQREDELRRQRGELDRLRREREESERVRLEAESVRAAALEEAERLRVETAQQSAALRSQVEAERARAAQTEAQLTQAREELARRDTANQQRIAAMQAELAKLAETRTSERGFIVTLPGLFFDTGKSTLKTGARNSLSKIADQLRANADVRIAIEGHTDGVGSEALNQTLSDKRAAAVRDYLANRGLPADRMTTTGLGETAPVATNDTAAGRQQNRRVELIITQHQQ